MNDRQKGHQNQLGDHITVMKGLVEMASLVATGNATKLNAARMLSPDFLSLTRGSEDEVQYSTVGLQKMTPYNVIFCEIQKLNIIRCWIRRKEWKIVFVFILISAIIAFIK